MLEKGTPSPLAKESDEEAGDEAEPGAGGAGGGESAGDADDVTVRIDFDGLDQRILALPLPEAGYANLQPGDPGQLFYVRSETASGFGSPGAGPSLQRFSLADREAATVVGGTRFYDLSADRRNVLYATSGGWFIGNAGGTDIGSGADRLRVADVQVRIDPRAEWRQIYDEAWRINRDYFYDPNMHGADWPAMKEKYAGFLPHLTSRADLNRLMTWLHSEIAVGHHRGGGGDFLHETDDVPGGLLGADFVVDEGRYRFEKVYGGLNWNPGLRSPLTEPGVEVEAGEYLLAVEGVALSAPENVYSRFENTAGRIVSITVGPSPDGMGSRAVDVVPVANEGALRNRDWVEGNLARVEEATDGRVAYVYVPNTAGAGHEYFKRYFFPQTNREAVIIDERHNGGGQIADYYINILRRPYMSHWADALRGRPRHAAGRDPGPEGDAHRRDRRFRRGHAAVDVPQARNGHAHRAPHLGRARGRPGFPGPDGRRVDHGAEPRDLDRGRVHRRKRGRAAGHRSGTVAGRRDRGRRPAVGEGDRGRAGATRGVTGGDAQAAALPDPRAATLAGATGGGAGSRPRDRPRRRHQLQVAGSTEMVTASAVTEFRFIRQLINAFAPSRLASAMIFSRAPRSSKLPASLPPSTAIVSDMT